MAKKILSLFMIFFSFTECSSMRTKTEEEKALSHKASYSYEELWQAIYEVSLHYPLHDISKEEGSVESDWISQNDLSQYRFFISVDSESTPPQFDIDIQSQKRKTPTSRWQWGEPSIDKSENLKNSIHEHLKKIRAT